MTKAKRFLIPQRYRARMFPYADLFETVVLPIAQRHKQASHRPLNESERETLAEVIRKYQTDKWGQESLTNLTTIGLLTCVYHYLGWCVSRGRKRDTALMINSYYIVLAWESGTRVTSLEEDAEWMLI